MYLKIAALLALLTTMVCITACEEQTAYGGQEVSLQEAKNSGWAQFGPSQRVAGTQVTVAEAAEAMEDVVLAAEIAEVCQTKGCWMTVKDGEAEMLVRFKNYGFFMPRNAAGHECAMHGNLEVREISVEALRAAAAAEGASEEEIAAITEPAQQLLFVADAVYVAGEGLDAPYKPGDEIDLEGHEHLDGESEGGAMVESGGCPGEDEEGGCASCPDAQQPAAIVEAGCSTEGCSTEGCSEATEKPEGCGGCAEETEGCSEAAEKTEGCGGCAEEAEGCSETTEKVEGCGGCAEETESCSEAAAKEEGCGGCAEQTAAMVEEGGSGEGCGGCAEETEGCSEAGEKTQGCEGVAKKQEEGCGGCSGAETGACEKKETTESTETSGG